MRIEWKSAAADLTALSRTFWDGRAWSPWRRKRAYGWRWSRPISGAASTDWRGSAGRSWKPIRSAERCSYFGTDDRHR